MTRRHGTIYLERRTYRRRRMMDAARLMPLIGMLLFLVPLLWLPEPGESVATSRGVIYIFAIWVILILVSAWIAAKLQPGQEDGAAQEPPK